MQNSKLPFSIIIPTLNEEKFLPRLLTSLKNQTDKDFEVIVVDGGSTDKTIQKAKKYEKFLPSLTIISSEKQNVSYQRNLGAKIAKGDYLIFLDADSKVSSAFIKKLQRAIKKTPGLIYLPKFVPDIKTPDIVLLFEIAYFLIEVSQYTPKPFSTGGEIIIRREIFHILGGFDEKLFLSEDHELIQRAKKFGITARLLSDIKVTFSLRRMQKEGKLKFFLKYLYSSAQTILYGRIERQIFDYEMGGHLYKKLNKQKNGLDTLIKNNLKRLKTLIQKTLKNIS